MKALKRIVTRLKLRYNLGREVVTVYLPVAAAVLFIISSLIYTGHIGLGLWGDTAGEGGTGDRMSFSEFEGKESFSDEDMARLLELKRKKSEKESGDDENHLDDILIFATLIAIIPYSIDLHIQKRKLRRYEEEFSDFLFEISEMMRGGIDPVKAIRELSKSNLGSITKHVRRATARMAFGKSFDYSMRKMASALKGNLINRYTDLLIHASFTGGNVSEIIMKSSEDMKKFINLDKEKEGNLKMYVVIIYMAQAILLLLSAVFMHYVLPNMEGVNLGLFFGGFGGGTTLSLTDTMTYVFHIVMINAFFVGLIAGKMSSGSMKFGLKHSATLLVGSYIIAFFFIMPQPTVTEPVLISPVSYPPDGFIGIPLKEPIIFKVTDLEGNPKENITVNFDMSGPSNGILSKQMATTDEDGLVSTKARLGVQEGIYKITARVDEYTGTVEIKAKIEE